jgi:DNA-binding transcriptional LysR family regulator
MRKSASVRCAEKVGTIPPHGNVQVRDGDALRTLALNDVGLVRLASFIVRDDIAANRLVPALEAFNPGDIDELHAVYLGQGGLLPLRVLVFLEFLAQRIKIGDGLPSVRRCAPIRALTYFVAVAEEGSLAVAAERPLHTAQPSLSRQIRDLEYEAGAQLLTRSARGIELTAAGRAFHDYA